MKNQTKTSFQRFFFSKKNELVTLQAVFPISIETKKCVVKRQTFEKMAMRACRVIEV